ncbi:37S ribosomal protein S16, mitochondrial [Xylographa opegraphella]|nr:37S ribosomal protein S16, mitochondrial [Xylographa opegraphella]
MAVKIRLARFGKTNAPFYNIVVANARTARNSKPLEVLGTYDPIPKPPPFGQGKPFKDIKLDTVRAKYWLGVGAQPSDPVWRLLAMVGLIEPKYSIIQARQQKPKPTLTSPRSAETAPISA